MNTLGVFDSSVQGVKRAFANVAASQTDAIVVAAVAKTKIRVLGYFAQAGGTATTLIFNTKPGGAGSPISMTHQNAANGGGIPQYMPTGWFETNSGEGLSVTTGAGSTTGIQVVYEEIRDQTA